MADSGDILLDAMTRHLEAGLLTMVRAIIDTAPPRPPGHRTRVRPFGPDAEATAGVLRALIAQLKYDRRSLYWREREAQGIHHPAEVEAWLSSLIDSGWAPGPVGPEETP